MSSRRTVIRFGQAAPEIMVHLDGRVQHGAAPPPSTPEALAETAGAADLVEEARRRADELLAQAAHEVADVHAEAYRLGHQAGHRDGISAGRAELADALGLVQAAGRSAKEARDQVVAGAEGDIVELVIAAVQAIVGEQARLNPTLVVETIERATQRLGNQNVLRVRVHPDDASTVAATLDARNGTAPPWEVLGDSAIGIGGCVIDTASGEVDARLDVQLEAVAHMLRTAVPHAV